MRIGILTFQNTSNYGATLQAYALQESIKKEGVDCKIIDYHEKKIKSRSPIVSKINASIRKFLVNISGGKKRNAAFKDANFDLSNAYTDETIAQANSEFDKFVVGSDQVWNIKLIKGNMRYFLDFVNDDEKKNSYAASIGATSLVEDGKEAMKKALASFKGEISVREETAKKLLSYELGIESTVVLDPTLLLTKDEWEKVAAPKTLKKKYVLVYQMGRSKSLIRVAKKEAKRIGAQLISIKPPLDNLVAGKNIFGAGPGEFVRLFMDAEKVFTNSFHGTVFSINFNKEFYVELLKMGNVNSRLTDVLKAFDLCDRIIKDEILPDGRIDYKKVNGLLDEKRDRSYEVIREILKK